MTKEEFEKAQKGEVWLVHVDLGLVKANQVWWGRHWAYLDGLRLAAAKLETFRLATANDFLKEG